MGHCSWLWVREGKKSDQLIQSFAFLLSSILSQQCSKQNINPHLRSHSWAQWIPVWYGYRMPPVQSGSFLSTRYSTVNCQWYLKEIGIAATQPWKGHVQSQRRISGCWGCQCPAESIATDSQTLCGLQSSSEQCVDGFMEWVPMAEV